MANKANPPPHQRLPQSILDQPELAAVFEKSNFDMFLLWKKLGGGSDFISDNQTASSGSNNGLLSKLFDIRKQIGSGKPVTIDTTGFTIDTTEQTIDMTEV